MFRRTIAPLAALLAAAALGPRLAVEDHRPHLLVRREQLAPRSLGLVRHLDGGVRTESAQWPRGATEPRASNFRNPPQGITWGSPEGLPGDYLGGEAATAAGTE